MTELVPDSILDPDVVIRNAELYRLLAHHDTDWLESVLREAVARERAGVLRRRHERFRHAAAEQLRRIPELRDSADELAPRWADYRFTRDTEAVLLISRLGASADPAGELEVTGLEEALAAAGPHRSPLFVSLHQNAYQALPTALAAVGLPAACIMDAGAKELAQDLMGALAPGLFERLTMIAAQSPTVREELLGPLMAGRPVLMLAEFAFRKSRSTTEFLGRTIHAPRGSERLAAAAGTPVIPVRLDVSNGRRRLEFGPAVWRPGDEAAPGEVTARLFAWIESIVTADPTQWWCWEVFETLMAADAPEAAAA